MTAENKAAWFDLSIWYDLIDLLTCIFCSQRFSKKFFLQTTCISEQYLSLSWLGDKFVLKTHEHFLNCLLCAKIVIVLQDKLIMLSEYI